ncbi:MAG: AI-2E family transporter [Bacteriovoracaceae bacterium]
MKRVDNRFLKTAFFIFVTLSICSLFLSMPRILIPFGIAYVFSLMLRPLTNVFYAADIKKKLLASLAVIFIAFGFIYPVVEGVQTITEEAHKVEYYLPRAETYLRQKYRELKVQVKYRFNYEIKTNPVDKLVEFGQEYTKSLFVYLPKLLGSLLEWGFIIPFFLLFILKDGRRMRFNFIKIIPNHLIERVYYLFHQFNTKFGDYIFAKFIEAAIVGSVITTGLLFLEFPFAFLLGLFAGITNILPYIGPLLGFAPALVVGLVDQNPALGAMAMLYIVANAIDLALVFPILVSKIVNLHPLVVVISVILGSHFGGIVGMIVSIPFAAFIKLLFLEIYNELYTNPSIK